MRGAKYEANFLPDPSKGSKIRPRGEAKRSEAKQARLLKLLRGRIDNGSAKEGRRHIYYIILTIQETKHTQNQPYRKDERNQQSRVDKGKLEHRSIRSVNHERDLN